MEELKHQNQYEILTPSGFKDFVGIKKISKDYYLKIKTEFNEINSSDGHPIYTKNGYVHAVDLKIGDEIKSINGYEKIISIEFINENCDLYDVIEVNDHQHRFIGNNLIISNCAFIESDWDGFYKSTYPVISSGKTSKVILVSTPNGLNHFYTIHNAARNGKNSYVPFEVTWRDVPGRDEAWRQETIANTSEEAFLQENENNFLGSSLTLIRADILRNMVSETCVFTDHKHMFIYKEPVINHSYFISVDTARGLGGDYSVASVIDITSYPFEQVAVYKNNNISSTVFPNIIHQLALKYNEAYTLVELNDLGESIANDLHYEYEYANHISIRDGSNVRPGLTVTTKTKTIGCNILKNMIESYKLKIVDESTINELFKFQEHNNSYAAVEGHDDIVMTLVNFAYFTNTPLFNYITEKNIKGEMQKFFEKEIDDDIVPFGIINNVEYEEQNQTDNVKYISTPKDDDDKWFFT